METITLFVDGLCEPTNPGGYACWAWLAVDPGGTEIASDYGCLGVGAGMTNNRAEYEAALQALTWAQEHARGKQLLLQSDSQLLINQITGNWVCKAPHLIPLCLKASTIVAQLGAQVQWIPRVENTRADALTRRAYHEARTQGRCRHG